MTLTDGMDDLELSTTRLSITLPSALSFSTSMQTTMLSNGKILCTTLSTYFSLSPLPTTAKCAMNSSTTLEV